MITPIGNLQPLLNQLTERNSTPQVPDRIREAADGFESLFVTQLLEPLEKRYFFESWRTISNTKASSIWAATPSSAKLPSKAPNHKTSWLSLTGFPPIKIKRITGKNGFKRIRIHPKLRNRWAGPGRKYPSRPSSRPNKPKN